MSTARTPAGSVSARTVSVITSRNGSGCSNRRCPEVSKTIHSLAAGSWPTCIHARSPIATTGSKVGSATFLPPLKSVPPVSVEDGAMVFYFKAPRVVRTSPA
jgi:hypothetical protein